MKKFSALFLCAALLASLCCLPAAAAHVSAAEAIETLEILRLVRGTGKGFEPERCATRAEATVMVLRLLGKEQEAEEVGLDSPFDDGGWADTYLGYAYEAGLVKGVTADHFDSDRPVSARDFLTMSLRLLGYTEGEDFTWQGSLVYADGLGLTHGEYSSREGAEFLREDMALVSYTALTLIPKGGEKRLIETLYEEGVVSAEDLKNTRLAGALNTGKPVYRAEEIYEMSSSAVVFTRVFDTEEDLEAGKPMGTGSGFFIRDDGVAVMSYHQLEGGSFAQAATTDGKVYEITGVLAYDPQRDFAVVRISRTDTEGETVRFFPYLDLGDSEALTAGEEIYTLSSPLGLKDSISDGLVSNKSRILDDPDYPCIQISAAISQGSSGGALLNRYGEVIGILYATFTRGQNLNLAVPINCVKDVDFSGEGEALSAVREREDEKKATSGITADRTELTLKVGEEQEVVFTNDCPGHASMQMIIGNPRIVSGTWGEFITRQSVPLTIRGEKVGETEITVCFADGYGNPEAKAVVYITVTE